jgi:predicted RNase H-like nuclease
MPTTFIGVDLAWKSERNPTGIAVLEGDRSGAELTAVKTIDSKANVADTIIALATAETVIAIDAPLIIPNATGQRLCERAVGRRYGSREASCHTSNLGLYPGASSVALAAQLEAQGFVHATQDQQLTNRVLIEVYPHAAMVALWDLPKTIKYKRGSVGAKREGLETLRDALHRLQDAEPRVRRNEVLDGLLSQESIQLNGQRLKNYEDQLDALFCAYLAYYFWYWRWNRNEMFGDVNSGYILNPTLQSRESSVNSEAIKIEYSDLIRQAHKLARPIRTSDHCSAGSVASVIISRSGNTYTGICLDFSCGLGFCAEHAAVAEMLKAHESEIGFVVAVDGDGNVLPPCGRCREMMWQLNPVNKNAIVVLAVDRARHLSELLPER